MLAMRWVSLGLVLAGCLHAKSHPCTGDDNASWVCPEDEACAAPPTYCGTANEVGACDGKMERDPCSTTLVPDGLCIDKQCTSCSNDIAGCRYVGWQSMTSGSSANLTAIAFTGFGEAYAGTDTGTILRYDTSAWSVDTRFPTTTAIVQTLVTAGTSVYAYTNDGMVYVLANNAWTTLPAPPVGPTYTAMWAAPSGDVFLVGTNGAYAHYNGSTWSPTTIGTSTMKWVWGSAANDVYAVGNGSAINHYDGNTWTPVTGVPAVGNLKTVWTIGNEVFVGGGLKILHGVGGVFTVVDSPPITVTQIWGSTATDVFAVGTGGAIVHWDGVSWVAMDVTATGNLAAVSGSSGAEVFAVGDGGAIVRYTGLGYAALANQPTANVSDIYAAAPNEAFVVGVSTSVFHYKGEVMTPEASVAPLTHPLTTIWGRSANDVFAVGDLGTATHYTGSWMTQSASMLSTNRDMWGSSASVYAAGAYVFQFDGTSWSQLVTTQLMVEGIWVAPSGQIWLADDTGIARLEGSTVKFEVQGARFNAIWGADENDIFAAGIGEIRHYDGSSWTAMTVPSGTPALTGLWGRAGDDVFAVGAAGAVLRYHAGLWQTLGSPLATDLASVSGAGAAIYIVGGSKVYRLLETSP
jgi:hypothetical protein